MSKKKKNIPDSNKEPLNRKKNIFANFKWSYVINFLITLFGVFGGVYFSNLYFQENKNESTINKFNLLYTECFQNVGTCYSIYLQLNDTSRTDYDFVLLYADICNELLKDDNFYSVGTAKLYDLLLYHSSLTTELNRRLETYSKSFQDDKSLYEKKDLLFNVAKSLSYNTNIRRVLIDMDFVGQVITTIHDENIVEIYTTVKTILEGKFEIVLGETKDTIPKSWTYIRPVFPLAK